MPTSSFSFFACTQERERIWEGDGLEDGGKTYLPQRNRFVNLSWPEPLHPVPVCALFTCLLKTSTSIKRWDSKDKTTETHAERNVFLRRPPSFVGYELLIITICELFYLLSLSPFLSLLSLMQRPFSRSRDYVLRAASTFNYTTPDN